MAIVHISWCIFLRSTYWRKTRTVKTMLRITSAPEIKAFIPRLPSSIGLRSNGKILPQPITFCKGPYQAMYNVTLDRIVAPFDNVTHEKRLSNEPTGQNRILEGDLLALS